jgi:XRE family aerobic/anaerobic benzoate catabolism transcriptional regulator
MWERCLVGQNARDVEYNTLSVTAPPKKQPKTTPGSHSRTLGTRAKGARPPKHTLQRKLQTSQGELRALLAQRVRDARARRFMSRKALAQQSGISLAYLARVESGTGNISLGLLQQLAAALNLPMESFLAAEQPLNADFTIIVEFLKHQTPQRLANIRRQLFDGHVPAHRIALLGIRGVGKSTVGPLLAERLNVPFIELNHEIEKEGGLAIGEIFTLYGQHGYRVLERRCLERIISEHPRVVLATGGGIVAEAASYELLLTSFYAIWLKAKPQAMFERVLGQHDARIASPELHDEALENIERTLQARRHLYELAPASFDTTGKSVIEAMSGLVELVLTALRSGSAAD